MGTTDPTPTGTVEVYFLNAPLDTADPLLVRHMPVVPRTGESVIIGNREYTVKAVTWDDVVYVSLDPWADNPDLPPVIVKVTFTLPGDEYAEGWRNDPADLAASVEARLTEIYDGQSNAYVPENVTVEIPDDDDVRPKQRAMSLRFAILTVTADTRRSFPDMSIRDAVENARNTLTLSDPPPLGASTVYDDGGQDYPAYVTVLSATDSAIESAIQQIEGQ